MWTKRDAAHQNAVDTCIEEGLHAGTDAFEERLAEMYKATLAMLQDDAGGYDYTPECPDCERQPFPKRCFSCHMSERSAS